MEKTRGTAIIKMDIMNAIENALMNDEISVGRYESIMRALLDSEDDKFEVITIDSNQGLVFIIP